jgi:hypothetical protein
MKRDDFGVRIDEIRQLATKYSKPDLARMVQMGMIEPQKALMAGMMIDRIAKSAMEPPQSTVAQDVLGQQPTAAQGQLPPGIMGAPGAPPPSAGVAALPSGIAEMAGGGIVAFDEGGEVPGYADGDLVSASDVFRRGLATQPGGEMPAVPAAPAGASALTLPGGFKFRDYAAIAPTDIKSELAALREAEREAGVDTDMYKRMREEESGRREELKKRREEAKGEALLMAGLGLMGARQGQEFQTLADVGRQAVQQYGASLREIRDTDKDIKKTERELMMAEDRAKRDMSGKALSRVQAKETKLEELQVRQTDQYNKSVEKASDLFVEQYKADEAAKRSLEVAKMNGDYQLAVARIHAASANRPGETERLLGRYHNILATQGAEAANKFMNELGMVRGVGKPQNTMSFEEAMKIVSNDVKYAGKTLEEKMELANQIVRSQPGLSSGATPTSGAAAGNRPSLSSFDKR